MILPGNVQRAIENGYTFRFSENLNRTFVLVRKNADAYVGATFVLFLIAGVLILLAIPLDYVQFIAQTAPISQTLVPMMISLILGVLIITPMSVGFYSVAHKADTGQSIEFGDFFAGYNKFGDLMVTGLLYALVMFFATLPGKYLQTIPLTELTGTMSRHISVTRFSSQYDFLSNILVLAPTLYITVSYAFAPMLTYFYGIKGWDALEASRKIAARNFWGLLGLGIVLYIIMIAGILFCCVGALVTIPAFSVGVYAAFSDAVSLNEPEAQQEDIIDHFSPLE